MAAIWLPVAGFQPIRAVLLSMGGGGGMLLPVVGFQPIRAVLLSGLGSLWYPSLFGPEPIIELGFAGNQPPRMLSLVSLSLSLEEVTEVVRWCSCTETMCLTFCLHKGISRAFL